MYIVNVFLFLLYCKDIYNFETIFSGRDYFYDVSYKSDSTYGCVRAAALWDADNERHGYSIKSKIRRTKEQIKNYIPLYVKYTGPSSSCYIIRNESPTRILLLNND